MEGKRPVWFLLVDGQGEAYKGTRTSKVEIRTDSYIDDFLDAVHAKHSNTLKGIDPARLVVYSNKAAFDGKKEKPLNVRNKIGEELGKDDDMYVVVKTLEIPQVQPRLPFSDGINPLGMHFDRQALLDRMHKWITGEEGRNRFLLLNSPAASGKTSLLVLFQHMYHRYDNWVIHYISLFRDNRDPRQTLIDFGLDCYKRTCNYPKVIYLLDDAQCMYDNPSFWAYLIKGLPLDFDGGVRFIISATHVISSVNESSPPDFKQLETIGRDDLLLSSDQSMTLLESNAPLGFPSNLQNYFELKGAIVQHCNGLIGALCKSVSFYGDQIRHSVPTQVECLQLFYSKKLLDHMDRCFGIVDNSRLYPEANNVLLKCVMGDDINSNTDVRLLDILTSFAKAGILLFDGYNFKFSSLLAKRYFTSRYIPTRASSDPPDLHQLVMQTIGSISAEALKLSTSSPADFPKETTFQHLFMLGLLCNTTHKTAICSELSRSFQNGTQVRGEINFFVDGDHMWGIELVRCGDKIGEHISRFSPMGKYSGLEAKDYIVVDFRRGTTNVRLDSHRATVSFQVSNGQTCFKEVNVKYGHRDPENLTLQP
ncbi:Aste57867_4335 [Aphanomyces stellatus]|uniref:Aste57867_4335 protein n=1 Tax=Aphanomyces stellatus TaxID=120398 RepID=A0A485KDN6_9STRA|nr:hypothetical protein As57867_004324 [Aphanomyces stellatus]VFT81449.1 Aste57867_4335 [Aphanomyces stellatus]